MAHYQGCPPAGPGPSGIAPRSWAGPCTAAPVIGIAPWRVACKPQYHSIPMVVNTPYGRTTSVDPPGCGSISGPSQPPAPRRHQRDRRQRTRSLLPISPRSFTPPSHTLTSSPRPAPTEIPPPWSSLGPPPPPPPNICWTDALGPNETFSSPIHTPAHSPSYSPCGGSVPLLCARRQRNIPLLCTRRQRQLTLMGLLWHPCVLFGTLGPLAAHSHVFACSFLLSHFFTRSRAFVRTHTWHLCVLFGFTNLARLSTPARSLARLCLFPPVVTPLHTFTRFRTHSHTFAKI